MTHWRHPRHESDYGMMKLWVWLCAVIAALVSMGFAIWYNPIAAAAGITLTLFLLYALIRLFIRAFEVLNQETSGETR